MKHIEYTLNREERRANKYPSEAATICASYENTKNWEKIEGNPRENAILSVDCEMVETAAGYELARISVINYEYETIYESFAKPQNPITNYHTNFSGIDKKTLENVTKTLAEVQQDLKKLIDADTILIGHSLDNDLHAMKLIHDRVIDTSVLFMTRKGAKLPLKGLAYSHLKYQIQSVDIGSSG